MSRHISVPPEAVGLQHSLEREVSDVVRAAHERGVDQLKLRRAVNRRSHGPAARDVRVRSISDIADLCDALGLQADFSFPVRGSAQPSAAARQELEQLWEGRPAVSPYSADARERVRTRLQFGVSKLIRDAYENASDPATVDAQLERSGVAPYKLEQLGVEETNLSTEEVAAIAAALGHDVSLSFSPRPNAAPLADRSRISAADVQAAPSQPSPAASPPTSIAGRLAAIPGALVGHLRTGNASHGSPRQQS